MDPAQNPPDGNTREQKNKATYKIENVVASITLSIDEPIDLMVVARKYNDVEYNPERFPGLIMRLKSPKATLLVFTSGKLVLTGLKKASEAPLVTSHAIDRLKDCGVEIHESKIDVNNIVASGDIKCMIDLNMAAVVMEYSMYEPEVFPGLVYRMQDPKCVFLIFSTGKVVCAGAKSEEIISNGIQKLYNLVREYGVNQEVEESYFDEDEMTFL